jgi:hypothetical protein
LLLTREQVYGDRIQDGSAGYTVGCGVEGDRTAARVCDGGGRLSGGIGDGSGGEATAPWLHRR